MDAFLNADEEDAEGNEEEIEEERLVARAEQESMKTFMEEQARLYDRTTHSSPPRRAPSPSPAKRIPSAQGVPIPPPFRSPEQSPLGSPVPGAGVVFTPSPPSYFFNSQSPEAEEYFTRNLSPTLPPSPLLPSVEPPSPPPANNSDLESELLFSGLQFFP